MYLPGILASLVSVAALTKSAVADLRITADHHSFGGVNYPQLQFLEPSYRDEVIRAIVKTNARVIRLFSRCYPAYEYPVQFSDNVVVRGDKDHGDV